MNGLFVVDKPSGITSRDAVDELKHALPRGTRLGHAGTLDPLATGVLVVCVGFTTRLVEYVQAMQKCYLSQFRLGVTSDTDDADGTIVPTLDSRVPTALEVSELLTHFCGEITQTPPAYSAARVEGRRAYRLARKGHEFDLEPRQVRIDSIELLEFEFPHVDVRIRCGKGTYIRSLARDLGQRLGCGAIVQTLRRTEIGPFVPEMAIPSPVRKRDLLTHLLSPALAVGGMPTFVTDDAGWDRLRHGNFLHIDAEHCPHRGEIAVFDSKGELRCIGLSDGVGEIRPAKIFA